MGETILSRDLKSEGVAVFSANTGERPWGFVPSPRLVFDNRSVVIGARGSIGFPRLPSDHRWTATQTTIVITCEKLDRIRPEWLLYSLRRIDFSKITSQQAIPMITVKDVEELELSLPPIEEQRRIAARLREQLSILAEARAALEAQLKEAKALPAANLRAVFESEEAQSWPLTRLGDLLLMRQDIVHPRNKPVGAARFVGLEHIEPHTGRRIGELPIQMEQMTGRKARFFSGDIVYGYLRPYLNKVWIADFGGLCSVDQYVFEVRCDLADTNFIAWFLRSSTYLSRAPIDQTPGWLPRIRTEEVAAVQINLPPLDRQREIAGQLEAEFSVSRALRESLYAKLSELEKLPAALLRSAFSRNGS
jgi:hypothetical protein